MRPFLKELLPPPHLRTSLSLNFPFLVSIQIWCQNEIKWINHYYKSSLDLTQLEYLCYFIFFFSFLQKSQVYEKYMTVCCQVEIGS